MYDGIDQIGVNWFGIFVGNTETKCEGMVRLVRHEGYFYELDEKIIRVLVEKG